MVYSTVAEYLTDDAIFQGRGPDERIWPVTTVLERLCLENSTKKQSSIIQRRKTRLHYQSRASLEVEARPSMNYLAVREMVVCIRSWHSSRSQNPDKLGYFHKALLRSMYLYTLMNTLSHTIPHSLVCTPLFYGRGGVQYQKEGLRCQDRRRVIKLLSGSRFLNYQLQSLKFLWRLFRYQSLESRMEVRGLSAVYHKALLGNTLLPFLYRTTTLQSPVRLTTTARPRSFHNTRPSQGVYIKNHSAIPFENEDGTYEQDLTNLNPREDRVERKTTITASEKLVFQRILNEISDDQIQKASKEEDPLDEESEFDLSGPDHASASLNALFEAALTEARHLDEVQTHKPMHDRPVMHYNLALNPFKNTATRNLERPLVIGDGYRKEIALAVAHHDRKVRSMLDAATSDRDIWSVLETEVFTLIGKYENLEKEANEQAGKPRGAAGRSVAKGLQAPAQNDEIEELRAILSSNYGEHCLAALRHLRRSYSISPYCMSLLPTIKRLGPMSHALAASLDLYNEIIFLQWKVYKDMHGMVDTIVEMVNLGIETNHATLFVLRLVHLEEWRCRVIYRNPRDPLKLWWTMAPVKESWQKLMQLSKEIWREKARAEMRRREVEEAEWQRTTEEEGGHFARGQEGARWRGLPEQRPGEEEERSNNTNELLTPPIML